MRGYIHTQTKILSPYLSTVRVYSSLRSIVQLLLLTRFNFLVKKLFEEKKVPDETARSAQKQPSVNDSNRCYKM